MATNPKNAVQPIKVTSNLKGIPFNLSSMTKASQTSNDPSDTTTSRKANRCFFVTRISAKAPYSPNQFPQDFRLSTWSKMIFRAAVSGTARIRPMAPHSHPQNSSAMVTARGFNCKRRPMILG